VDASKVNISPEMLSKHLTNKRKTEIRHQRIIELINSKPVGAHIKLGEFGAVTNMSEGAIHKFLRRMAASGLISIEKLSPHELTYHVLSDEPRVEWRTITPHSHNSDVVDLAMRYYWETQDDSLHKFVEWVAKTKERG